MTNSNNSVRVAAKKDLKEGGALCVKVGDRGLALFQIDGKIYAADNACPHVGGPLCEGGVKDGVVTCPWHGSQFKIDTGEVVHGPAKEGLKIYPVEVRGDDLYASLS